MVLLTLFFFFSHESSDLPMFLQNLNQLIIKGQINIHILFEEIQKRGKYPFSGTDLFKRLQLAKCQVIFSIELLMMFQFFFSHFLQVIFFFLITKRNSIYLYKKKKSLPPPPLTNGLLEFVSKKQGSMNSSWSNGISKLFAILGIK